MNQSPGGYQRNIKDCPSNTSLSSFIICRSWRARPATERRWNKSHSVENYRRLPIFHFLLKTALSATLPPPTCVFTSVKGWKLTLMLIWAEYTRCCSLFYANTHNISSVSMHGHTQQYSGLCSGHVFKLDYQQDIRAMDTNHRSG